MTDNIRYGSPGPSHGGTPTRRRPVLGDAPSRAPPPRPFELAAQHELDAKMRMYNMIERRGNLNGNGQQQPPLPVVDGQRSVSRQHPRFMPAASALVNRGLQSPALASSQSSPTLSPQPQAYTAYHPGAISPSIVSPNTRPDLSPGRPSKSNSSTRSNSPVDIPQQFKLRGIPQHQDPQQRSLFPTPWRTERAETSDHHHSRSRSRRNSLEFISAPTSASQSSLRPTTLERSITISNSDLSRPWLRRRSSAIPPIPPAKDARFFPATPPAPPAENFSSASFYSQRNDSTTTIGLAIGLPPPPPKAPAPPSNNQDDMSKSKLPSKKGKGDKNGDVLENVFGIYAADDKLPPGRSAADVFTSKLRSNLFSWKSKGAHAEHDKATDAPGSGPVAQNDFGAVAELPGCIPDPPGYTAQSGKNESTLSPPYEEVQGDVLHHEKPGSRGRVKGVKSRKAPPKAINTGNAKYEKMPLPAPPPAPTSPLPPLPDAKASNKPLKVNTNSEPLEGQDGEDSVGKAPDNGILSPEGNYSKDLADWFDSMYVDEKKESGKDVVEAAKLRASVLNPEGAVRGLQLPPKPSRSTLRAQARRRAGSNPQALASPTLEWNFRGSNASSIAEAFEFDKAEPGTPKLAAIGEDVGMTKTAEERETEASWKDVEASLKDKSDGNLSRYDEWEKSQGYDLDELEVDYDISPGSDGSMHLPDTLDDLDSTDGELYDDDGFYSGDNRSSAATSTLLDSEIEAILAERRRTMLARRYSANKSTPLGSPTEFDSDSQLPDSIEEIDELLEEKEAAESDLRFKSRITTVLDDSERAMAFHLERDKVKAETGETLGISEEEAERRDITFSRSSPTSPLQRTLF